MVSLITPRGTFVGNGTTVTKLANSACWPTSGGIVLNTTSEYVNKAGSATYATYFFGKDGFGIIDPEGGAMEMIIKDRSEIGGPLNQFSSVGFKLETNGATILYNECVLRVMSCSSYSAIDEAN